MSKTLFMKLFLLLWLAVGALSAQAVLKEQNFEQTLNVLRAELEQGYKKQKSIIAMYEQRTKSQHEQLIVTMKKYNQISLILYSQKEGFTFDMAYACQQATELYRNTNINTVPYQKIRQRMKAEVERYDLLIKSLEELPPAINNRGPIITNENGEVDSVMIKKMNEQMDSIAEAINSEPFLLNEHELVNREECVIFAKALRNNMVRLMNQIEKDVKHYEKVTKNIEELYLYAQKKYEILRKNIFSNRGDNYFAILLKLPQQLRLSSMDIHEKYMPFDEPAAMKSGHKHSYDSQWRGAIIPLTSVFLLPYILLSLLISFALTHWLVPKNIRNNITYRRKKPIILIAMGFIIFMITASIVKNFLYNNFLIMAMSLLMEFSWLVVFILLSLLFRLSGDQIKEGTKQYTPFLVMAFIVIIFRIVFIPNNLVNIIFPPLLLAFTFWQANMLRKRKVELPGSDLVYSVISLIAMILACVMSIIGYTLLAVEIMIWWTFQLACIQTITFLFDLCKIYEAKYLFKRLQKNYRKKNNGKIPTDALKEKGAKLKEQLAAASTDDERAELSKKIEENEKNIANTIFNIHENITKRMKKGDYISNTWLFDFIIMAILPILAVVSVLLSLFMAAELFDMADIFIKYLSVDFIQTSLMHLSIMKLSIVASLFFIFKYINYSGHALYKVYKNKRIELYIAEEKKKHQQRGVHQHSDEDIVPPNSNITLANNIITLLVWGSYCILILYLLNVPKSGITIITTGLATGMGFAMKDLLENFFYGLSLMTGRIRIGDYIECDGIAGKVESITYQSTQIVTRDGCVIAFLNTQLFSKNFKNLTRNHKYEMIKIPIGVAYGTNVQHVREIITTKINNLIEAKKESIPTLLKKGTNVSVVFSNFGESSVDLLVVVWVMVEHKVAFTSEAMEEIYNTLNEHNIEIPFPQHDIHIRDSVNLPISNY